MYISKVIFANQSEISIRVFRAANQLGLKTVAIWAEEDKCALRCFKVDESYFVGRGQHLDRQLGPIEGYLSIDDITRTARLSGADAIHSGYGLLPEALNSPGPAVRRASSSGQKLPAVAARSNAAMKRMPEPRCRASSRPWRERPDSRSVGDVLLLHEAMKMETVIHAERAGTIAEVPVRAGDRIDAKGQLVIYGFE